MGPRFDKIELDSANGLLLVEGPFETHGEVIDDVFVRFLVVAEGLPDPVFGATTVANLTPTGPITTGRFSETVTAPTGLRGGDEVRAVGLSVALKKADSPDPPAFETFTWCVNHIVSNA